MQPSHPPLVDPAISRDLVETWLREAGQYALARQDEVSFRLKRDRTPVTDVDEWIESLLVERIRSHFPGHSIIGEEGGRRGGSAEFVWAIDPLDGTRAYASGLPVWAVSIGVLRNAQPWVGGVYLPAIDRLYWADTAHAYRGSLELCEGVPPDLDDVRGFVAVPANAHRHFQIDFPRVRSFGSTLAHLIYTADSTALAAVTRQVMIWDLAGALPLLERCGVALCYLSGAAFSAETLLDGRPLPEALLVARPELMAEMRRRIRPLNPR